MEFKKHVQGFTSAAHQILLDYSWPGNVRELSNCLERTMIFIEKEWIAPTDLLITGPLPGIQAKKWAIPPTGIDLVDVERQLIESALKLANANKTQAARLLGLTRDTLRYRLEKYKLS
jgi:DNA-binding NtrC family response regulator